MATIPGDRARSIQLRLNHGQLDALVAATEARDVFASVGDAVRTLWLDLELGGYGAFIGQSLRQVLTDARLAAHVLAYRRQIGQAAEGQAIEHFFIEPLERLMHDRLLVARQGGVTLTLDLGAYPQNGPSVQAHFGMDIFERILGGFAAALHLQLGSIVR